MILSQECLDLVGEAFKLNHDDPNFKDKGGDLVWRLARVKVRGGDPHNKGKEDVGAIFKSHYNGNTKPFEMLYAKCLEDAWKEWDEEKAGDAADISAALNALEDERAAEQQAEEESNQPVTVDFEAEAAENRKAILDFDQAQRQAKQPAKVEASPPLAPSDDSDLEAPKPQGAKSGFSEVLKLRTEEIEEPGAQVRRLLEETRAKAAEEERRAAEQNTERKFQSSFFQEGDHTKAPGILGEIVEWIAASAMYPSRKLAFLSSLAIVGALASHRVMGPTGTGPNLYLIGLGNTTVGKNDALKAIACALYDIGAKRLVAPRFKSSVAMIDELKIRPVFVARIDEYGDFIAQMSGPKAGTYETGLMSSMKEIFSVGYAPYDTPAGKHDRSVTIYAPQATVAGFSAEKAFFGAMKSRDIVGGFLNRHGAAYEHEMTPLNEAHAQVWKLPPTLKEGLQPLFKPRADLSNLLKTKHTKEDLEALVAMPFTPEIIMTWGPGAKEIFTNFAAEMRAEKDEVRRDLFGRAAEIAVKVGTVVAYGRGSNTVDLGDMLLGKEFALQSAEIIYAGVLKYMEDPHNFPALCRRIIELLSEAPLKRMSLRDINRKCQGIISRGANVEEALKFLYTAERIRYEERSTGGRPTVIVELLSED